MLGLIVLAFIGAYLLVSALVVWLAARWARKHNRRAWIWGGLAAFAMYNLVFWDWVPTIVMHKYYCSTEAGLWVYKTPEQWVKENPEVMETLDKSHLPEQFRVNTSNENQRERNYLLLDGTELRADYDAANELMYVKFKARDGSSGYQLNERIRQIQQMREPRLMSISRRSETLIDLATNEVLARYVDFRRGTPNPLGGGGPNLADLKFWLSEDHCGSGRKNYGNFLVLKRNYQGGMQ